MQDQAQEDDEGVAEEDDEDFRPEVSGDGGDEGKHGVRCGLHDEVDHLDHGVV